MLNASLIAASVCLWTSAGIGSIADDLSVLKLDTPAGVHAPQAAVDAKGRVFVVYASAELVSISSSSDAGGSFGAPTAVGRIGKIAVGMRRGPRVTVARETVVVSAIGGARGGGHDGDLVAWRSTSGGTMWNAPVRVSDLPGSAREGLHAMAAGPKGEVACAWIDVRSGKGEVYAAVSSDDGAAFGANRLAYHSPAGSVCECCSPSIAIDAQGVMHVMFRNQLDGARDMYLVESKDGGKTFSDARKLGTGTWKIAMCPMDGGALAVDAQGKIASIWRREKEIYSAAAGPAAAGLAAASPAAASPTERRVDVGEQPWIASSDAGLYSTWLSRRGGDLWLLAPKADAPVKIASDAIDPMLASSPDGTGPVVVVWESKAGDAAAIYLARVDRARAPR